MNKEVYLSNLEWIKTHDNKGGVKGNIVFKENMSYEDFIKLQNNLYFILCDKEQLNKQKEVLDKSLYWLSENTHYTDFNVDKLVLDENANLKELLELLEEIE